MNKHCVAASTVRRLPRYLQVLDELSEKNVSLVTSNELGQRVFISPSRVRQDLREFGEFGVRGSGYDVQRLRSVIASILGAEAGIKAILIGVTQLSCVLVTHFPFSEYGVDLRCAFDTDVAEVGEDVNGIPIYELSSLEDYLSENTIDLVVLTSSKQEVMKSVNMLASCDVKAIWNFTDADLQYDNTGMYVENIRFSESLRRLCFYISDKNDSL